MTFTQAALFATPEDVRMACDLAKTISCHYHVALIAVVLDKFAIESAFGQK